MRFRLALCAALAALALGACGGDDDDDGGGGDEDAARAVVQQLLDADPEVCDKVTDRFLEQVGGTKEECRESAESGESIEADIGSAEVDGDSAEVVVDDEEGDRSTFTLVKEDGDWLLDAIEADEGGGEETTP